MKTRFRQRGALPLFIWTIALLQLFSASAADHLKLHPDNPHYFLFRGKPTVIITSGEHYGALLNLDFDYKAYFEALEKDGMNNTRVFSGAYAETGAAFNISNNTLDPAPNRFITPWARSEQPGYADGGNKFDLKRWDETYFKRLRDFMQEASRRGVIVEMNLFCPMYEESMWSVSPMNAKNNVNNVGDLARTNIYDLTKNGALQPIQEAMVRRIVSELRDFDNLYYEICNEPYFGGVTMAWQHRIVDVIVDAEKGFPQKHLISLNIANGSAKIEKQHPAVSIFNFHYASPADVVGLNYGLNKVIGDNETGFKGTNDAPYRMEAWEFMLAGGGLFNHLDYSFTVEHPRGTWTTYPASQPGGGNPGLRKQFAALKNFLHQFDFLQMKPLPNAAKNTPGYTVRVLGKAGEQYAAYLRPQASAPQFSARWTGTLIPNESANYTLYTVSNDGARVWVNDKLVIDDWAGHADKEASGSIELEKGKRYQIKVEHFQGGGTATMQLLWAKGGSESSRSVIDASVLRNGEEPGLLGEYFAGQNFDEKRISRVDKAIDFKWGSKSPLDVVAGEKLRELTLSLADGTYRAEWIDPVTGKAISTSTVQVKSGTTSLKIPEGREDIALALFSTKPRGAAAQARPKLSLRSETKDEVAFPIRASKDGRYFVDRTGAPFLYHADTAWTIAKKLTRAEIDEYLDLRKAQGFTAIHVHTFSKEVGRLANLEGHEPFEGENILKPNEAYWQNLDYVIAAAEKRDLLVAMAAIWIRWGGKDKEGWRYRLTEENAARYAEFLGKRYKRFKNLIWILGGDANPIERTTSIALMGRTLHKLNPHQLITVHNAPEYSSASFFHGERWLGVNMAYTYGETYRHVLGEWNRLGERRPIFLGESGYEEESNDKRGGSPQRMRRQFYGAILSGALGGHAYGHRDLWRFEKDKWRTSANSPGAKQMAIAHRFFADRPWHELRPDQFDRIFAERHPTFGAEEYIYAAVAEDGSWAVAYTPVGQMIRLGEGANGTWKARWLDPTDGEWKDASPSSREFKTPGPNAAGDNDWLLLLEREKAFR